MSWSRATTRWNLFRENIRRLLGESRVIKRFMRPQSNNEKLAWFFSSFCTKSFSSRTARKVEKLQHELKIAIKQLMARFLNLGTDRKIVCSLIRADLEMCKKQISKRSESKVPIAMERFIFYVCHRAPTTLLDQNPHCAHYYESKPLHGRTVGKTTDAYFFFFTRSNFWKN